MKTIEQVAARARVRLDGIRAEHGSADETYQSFLPLVTFVESLLKSAASQSSQRPDESPSTRWRIVGVDEPTRRRGLDVPLVVATDAPAVIDAIEEAADKQGVWLERVSE